MKSFSTERDSFTCLKEQIFSYKRMAAALNWLNFFKFIKQLIFLLQQQIGDWSCVEFYFCTMAHAYSITNQNLQYSASEWAYLGENQPRVEGL